MVFVVKVATDRFMRALASEVVALLILPPATIDFPAEFRL